MEKARSRKVYHLTFWDYFLIRLNSLRNTEQGERIFAYSFRGMEFIVIADREDIEAGA